MIVVSVVHGDGKTWGARMGKINMETWNRRDQYNYFSKMQLPYCSVTCELDVTAVRRCMKEMAIPSYLGMIYLVTKAANLVSELKLRIEGDDVYAYDVVHPSFTILNDDKQLYFCRAQYHEAARTFIEDASMIAERTKNAPQCALASNRQDVLYLSCNPWMHFTSLSHPMNLNQADAIPRIAWGKFTPKDDKTIMAVNLQVHHGLVDGYHMAQFMQNLGEFCTKPETAFSGVGPCPSKT